MIFDKKDNITIVTQESVSLATFVQRLNDEYHKLQNDHLIINLFSLDSLTVNHLLEFLQLSNKHRGSKKSFVIATNKVSYDDIPDEMVVVPTLQEAFDVIEMEEIERDLDF
jgi:hypothetical protein